MAIGDAEGLNGAADLDGDDTITAREVHLYVQRRVLDRSGGVPTPHLWQIRDVLMHLIYFHEATAWGISRQR